MDVNDFLLGPQGNKPCHGIKYLLPPSSNAWMPQQWYKANNLTFYHITRDDAISSLIFRVLSSMVLRKKLKRYFHWLEVKERWRSQLVCLEITCRSMMEDKLTLGRRQVEEPLDKGLWKAFMGIEIMGGTPTQ